MATQFVVDVRGLDTLKERLRPGRLLQPSHKFIADLGRTAQKTAQRAAKPHPADKGTLGRQILLEISDGGQTATVLPNRRIAGIAFTIEEGRRPGRRPPYGPIKRWAVSHGIVSGARGSSKEVQALREDIKAHGTKGIHFLRQAAEAAEKALGQGIPRTEKEIHDIWERG